MLLHNVYSEEDEKDGEMFNLSTNNFCHHVLPQDRLWKVYCCNILKVFFSRVGCFTRFIEPNLLPASINHKGPFLIWHFSFHVLISSLSFIIFLIFSLHIILIIPGINCILAFEVFCLCYLKPFLETGKEGFCL